MVPCNNGQLKEITKCKNENWAMIAWKYPLSVSAAWA
jgi:hypothetical protein